MAADFLQDLELLGMLLHTLSRVFVPEPKAKRMGRFIRLSAQEPPQITYFPSEKQRTRACKIVQAVPPHLLLSVVSAAEPIDCLIPKHVDFMCDHAMARQVAQWNQIIFLLLLLPPSCHPAVLQARLPEITSSHSLDLPDLPDHLALDDAAPARASLLVQVLSAAAVLSGGSPHRVWDPNATPTVPPHLQLSPHAIPLQVLIPRKRRRDTPQPDISGTAAANLAARHAAPLPVAPAGLAPAAMHDAAASLTSLSLSIPRSSAQHLTRTFGAISQLKTLRELTLTADFTCCSAMRHRQCPPPDESDIHRTIRMAQTLMVATLHALPGLSRLHMHTHDPPVGPHACNAPSLLHGISDLTQLVSLSLPRCIDCNSSASSALLPQTERDAVLSLSRLTRLTCLRLYGVHMNDNWAAVFAEVLDCLVALQTLDIAHTTKYAMDWDWLAAQGVTVSERGRVSAGGYGSQFSSDGWTSSDDSEPSAAGSSGRAEVYCSGSSAQARGCPLVLHVCRSTALTALRSLNAADTYAARPAEYLRCLDAQEGGALRQLTALQLQCCCFGRSDAVALGAMLAHLPALQTLNLAGNVFRDPGMAAVAGALPQMTALTALDVSDTLATCAGALRLLEAAGEMVGGGVDGLRRLALADIWLDDNPAAVAGRLRRLVGLEELVLCGCCLDGGGLVVVVGSLQPLTRLRLLDISGDGPALAAVPLLAQATALRQVEIEGRDGAPFQHEGAEAAGAASGGALKDAILAAAPWLTVAEMSTWRGQECYW